MTVLRSAQPAIDISEGFRNMNADPVGSVQSNGDSAVNAYCQDKLGSLSEGELQTLSEVNE